MDRKRGCPTVSFIASWCGASLPPPPHLPQDCPLSGNPHAEFVSSVNTEAGIFLSTVNTPQEVQTPLLFMGFLDSSAGNCQADEQTLWTNYFEQNWWQQSSAP